MSRAAIGLWALFDNFPASAKNLGLDAPETLRIRLILGYHALEAELAAFWRGSLLGEWDALLSMILSLDSNEDALHTLVAQGPREFTRAQWIATLAYLRELNPASAPMPSLSELAILFTLARSEKNRGAEFVDFCSSLVLLQRQRARVSDFSKPVSLGLAQDAVQSLEKLRRLTPRYVGKAPQLRSQNLKIAA